MEVVAYMVKFKYLRGQGAENKSNLEQQSTVYAATKSV